VSPAADPTETDGTDEAEDHELERPATEAGPLSRKDFPRPRQLGAGWEFSVDPGDAEAGYVGNGTPALARDPGEVVQLAVPLGCPRPRKMPLPDFALEVDYTVDGTKVVAIRGEFKDQGSAEIFFGARAANLRRCLGRSGSEAIGPLVGTARAVTDDVLLSDRTPESAPWAELAVRDGDQVVLVAAQSRLGRPPMTPGGARRLAEVFRR